MNNLLLPNVTFIPSETYNIDTVPKKNNSINMQLTL